MNFRAFFVIFITILLAELGDKTNLATFSFATHKEISKTSIFLAGTLAFMVASLIAIVAGEFLSNYVSHRVINIVSGALFVTIGVLMLISAIK